jgi:hypothetical protein
MNYAKIDGTTLVTYPYGPGELEQDRPGSFVGPNYDLVECFNNTDLSLHGFSLVQVTEEAVPVFNSITQRCALSTIPIFKSNNWVLTWITTNKSEEELALELYDRKLNVRARRKEKLVDTDWTQLQDAPVDSVEWAAYRQQLRDITNQPGFPDSITWPTEPSSMGIVRV